MKFLKATIPLILLLSAPFASAQDPIVVQRLKAISNKFEKLPIEDRKEYVKLKQKAIDASKQKKYFTCMVAIDDALNIFPEDMDLIWLKGVCRAEIHDVDAAVSQYDQVLKINPTHGSTLVNLVEINFFVGRYEEAVKYIEYIKTLVDSRGSGYFSPLLNFKYLISVTKLEKENPGKYGTELKRLHSLHSYMDDNPYYYYANALKCFDAGEQQEGLVWIFKAYLIFDSAPMVEVWNKALVDTDYMGAYEVMFSRSEKKKR